MKLHNRSNIFVFAGTWQQQVNPIPLAGNCTEINWSYIDKSFTPWSLESLLDLSL